MLSWDMRAVCRWPNEATFNFKSLVIPSDGLPLVDARAVIGTVALISWPLIFSMSGYAAREHRNGPFGQSHS